MAYYGKKSNTKPRVTGKACEVCGLTPEMRWHKHSEFGTTLSIEKHSQNRIRILPYYADKINRPDLADKMLCPECAEELIFKPINK